MNYRLITVALIATLALTSCKKDVDVSKDLTGGETAVEQTSVATDATNTQTVDPNAKFSKMEFSKLEHDFGTINGVDVVETVFTFTNTGDTDLLISKAQGSCGCTVPEYPKQPIAPGATADIKVSFSPVGKNGMQNKTVTLTTNTATGMEQLTVKANIVK